MSDAQEVTRHAELLVTDYLKSWHCSRALDVFTSKLSDRPLPSLELDDRFNTDVARRDKATDRSASLLEYMARSVQRDISASASKKESASAGGDTSSRRRRSSVSSDNDAGVSMGDWTKQDVSSLKKAIKQTAQLEDKNERWKQIAALLGDGKTKKQCYLKYKQLKEEQKAAGSSPTSDPAKKSPRSSSSSGRRRSADTSAGRRDSIDSISSDVTPQAASLGKEPSPFDSAANFNPREDDSVPVKITSGFTRDSRPAIELSTFVPVVSRSSSTASERLEMEDCEDFDIPTLSMPTSAPKTSSGSRAGATARVTTTTNREGVAPTADQISSVRRLLFGSQAEGKTFNLHWEEQGFCFSDTRNLQYGLVQHEGGPCGVLAVVQAYVLRFMLQQPPLDWHSPDVDSQQRALVHALAHILWQSSQSQQCTLVLSHDHRAASDKRHKFMANVMLHSCSSEAETRELLRTSLAQFMAPRGRGLVQFVLSVVLTRGVATIASEMDGVPGASEIGGQLIGGHDYCTQEMVNLLLCGRAVSNVFDGERSLEDGSSVKLHGIPSRGAVGFLSLFEAYEYLVVGSNLKRPVYNVWVVCSESHYSVLFADPPLLQEPATSLDARESLDLFYYDGLANQDEQIRLTVATRARPEGSRVSARHDDLVPPLNLVIQTKWPRAEVDWNGVDPLL